MRGLMNLFGVVGAMLMNADDGANAAGGAAPVEGAPTPETATPVAAKKPRVKAEDFIKACNESNSIAEVAAKTGLKPNNVHQRRHQLAKDGVQLKQYVGKRGGNKLDIEALKALGAASLPEGATAFVPTTRPRVETPEAPQAPQDGQTEQVEQPAETPVEQTAQG